MASAARNPHPSAMRSARFVGLAVMAIVAASLLVVDWTVAVPSAVANAAAVSSTAHPPMAPMDIGQQFYEEKARATEHELPAQF